MLLSQAFKARHGQGAHSATALLAGCLFLFLPQAVDRFFMIRRRSAQFCFFSQIFFFIFYSHFFVFFLFFEFIFELTINVFLFFYFHVLFFLNIKAFKCKVSK